MNRTNRISGGDELTPRFATPADFPLQHCSASRGPTRATRKCGICPSFKGHFLSPVQFCFTGRMGLKSNLTTEQIVEQVSLLPSHALSVVSIASMLFSISDSLCVLCRL